MKNKLMIGLWRYMINIPPFLWEKQIARAQQKFRKEIGFMTREHRLVHHFVVRELPLAGAPLSPDFAADKLKMPLNDVKNILDDLEKNMTYLYRNGRGEVVWAYPVTVEKTPHRAVFSSGEELFAA